MCFWIHRRAFVSTQEETASSNDDLKGPYNMAASDLYLFRNSDMVSVLWAQMIEFSNKSLGLRKSKFHSLV